MKRYYQDHEQERAHFMAATTIQTAVTFPEAVAGSLETVDRLCRIEFLMQLADANGEELFLADQPSEQDWRQLEAERLKEAA